MARHKDANINLPDADQYNRRGWESIYVGLLMDLRDEMKEGNRLQREILYLLKRNDRRAAKHFPLR